MNSATASVANAHLALNLFQLLGYRTNMNCRHQLHSPTHTKSFPFAKHLISWLNILHSLASKSSLCMSDTWLMLGFTRRVNSKYSTPCEKPGFSYWLKWAWIQELYRWQMFWLWSKFLKFPINLVLTEGRIYFISQAFRIWSKFRSHNLNCRVAKMQTRSS